MSNSRVLLLLLLVSGSVTTLAAQSSPAQSSPAKNLIASRFHVSKLVAPPEFRAQITSLPPVFLPPKVQFKELRSKIRDLPPRLRSESDMSPDDSSCLAIRDYRVIRDDPKSDFTRFAGYSECVPAERFQLGFAVIR
jgi:hypothetical protein